MSRFVRSALALCGFSLLCTLGCKQQSAAPKSTTPPPVHSPPRISSSQPRPEDLEIPELPPGADELPEITLQFTGADGAAQTLSRSKDRIHLSLPHRHQEWLFIRNPVDPRRVTGMLIDHENQALLVYPETDLRVEGIARGWADLIAIDEQQGKATQGIDPSLIQDPIQRFPQYQVFDIADWREEHHEEGHAH